MVPSIGSKELVALLPSLLGINGQTVLVPAMAYPTYDVGARLAGCTPVPVDDVTSADPAGVGLVWINSPGNPTGEVCRRRPAARHRGLGPRARRADRL